MKDDRAGEHLWVEWDGDFYEASSDDATVYFTFDHVDLTIDIVKRGLASCIQRDGVADSLGSAFVMIDNGQVSHLWAGVEESSGNPSVCDESGETYYGDPVTEISAVTFVEL